MASRAIPWIRKNPLMNAITGSSFSPHISQTTKNVQSFFTSAFSVAVRDVTSPSFRSVIGHSHCGSSSGLTNRLQSQPYSSTSGIYANVRLGFSKQRRNRGEIKGTSDNQVCFGKYGLQVLEPAWITSRQILAGQLAIKRTARGGKSLIRVFPHKPVSLRPAETRMGRGKGNIAFWVAGVKPGRILYELNGVPENIARKAILLAASKMPVRTRFVKS